MTQYTKKNITEFPAEYQSFVIGLFLLEMCYLFRWKTFFFFDIFF